MNRTTPTLFASITILIGWGVNAVLLASGEGLMGPYLTGGIALGAIGLFLKAVWELSPKE